MSENKIELTRSSADSVMVRYYLELLELKATVSAQQAKIKSLKKRLKEFDSYLWDVFINYEKRIFTLELLIEKLNKK